MSPSLLVLLSLLPLGFWLALSLDRRRAWPRECFLPAAVPPPAEGEAGPRVTVVVPARDEAEVLPRTLGALLEQETAGPFGVILVDDGSTDGTAEVARRVAADAGREDRLEVVRAPSRPPGWTGKVHALSAGVARACAGEPPEWLLFTDADIRHRPGSVAALLATARRGPGDGRGRYDLVSVMARLHARTFWERLLIPAFVFYFGLLYPFREVKDPASPVAAAAGGCILLRRQALEAAGGVASIRGAVIDDVSLARRVAAAGSASGGGRLWLGFDPGIVSVRPYRGLGELWRMVSRSAFVQLRHSWALLILVLLGLALLVASPPWLALASVWTLVARVPGSAPGAGMPAVAVGALTASLAAWGLQARALAPAVIHHRVPQRWAWALPFASVLYGLMTLSSAWDHLRGRGSRWKGRSYGPPAGGRSEGDRAPD